MLGLSICAVWLPSVKLSGRRITLWPVLFVGALSSGLYFGYLKPIAIAELGIFAGCAYLSNAAGKGWQRGIFSTVTVISALALAMHLLPGFKNPVLVANVKFSVDAAAFTQYLNFDKTSVGLILLAFLCVRSGSISEWRLMLRRTFPVAIITTTIVIAAALASGFLKPDFKLSSYTLVFFTTNLIFTCVAEEAFFRGLVQEKLAAFFSRIRYGGAITVGCSAILFGLAHISGGFNFALLATLAGLGNAYSYFMVRRIEAPIVTHFSLNAVHFVFFSYPHI